MLRRWIPRIFGAFAALLLGVAPASADIKSFNAAVKAGNYKQAAAEAKAVWATWDRQDRDTAMMAREFGFISYVAGDYAAAREFGQFLKDSGASLPTPDDLPATSAVLLTASSFRLDPNAAARTALLDALRKRQTAPGLDMQTVLAAEALYTLDRARGNAANTWESAKLGWDLLARGGPQLAVRSLRARSVYVTAGFLKGRQRQDYNEIADAHDAVIDAINVSTSATDRAELISMKYNLQAWANSVRLYFGVQQQTGSLISKQVRDRDLKEPATALFPTATPPDLACKKEFDPGEVRYPTSELYRGMIGTVILKVNVDYEGRITQPEVLASVPDAGFADALMGSIHTARFKRARDAEPGCMLATPVLVVPVTFTIL